MTEKHDKFALDWKMTFELDWVGGGEMKEKES